MGRPSVSKNGNLRRPAVDRARKLRREMSLPEVLLWQQLKQRPNNLKFRKQHPIEPYIVDFYCAEKRLVIEIDGISHDMGNNQERDQRKDAFLAQRGLEVLRVPAKEVLRDVVEVAQSIADYAATRSSPETGGDFSLGAGVSSNCKSAPSISPPPSASGAHLPRSGEDF